MNADLVASLGAATLLGVPLAERGYLGGGRGAPGRGCGSRRTAALLAFVTQRFLVAPNTVLADLPEAMARVHQLMPALSALGVAGRRRRRAGGAARLLGVQRGVDARPVGGRVAVVPHAGLTGSPARNRPHGSGW